MNKSKRIEELESQLRMQLEVNSELTFQLKKFERRIRRLEARVFTVHEVPELDFYDMYCKCRLGSMEDMSFSTRTRHCLRQADILDFEDLVGMTDKKLLKLKNFGQSSLTNMKVVLLGGCMPSMNLLSKAEQKLLKQSSKVWIECALGWPLSDIAEREHITYSEALKLYWDAVKVLGKVNE